MHHICAAVHHAHRNLVLHRDIKPGNILVATDGTPKLLDFGIAKLIDPAEGNEHTNLTLAPRPLTPEYASPEQVRGETITTAADVYLLGAVLYELLTGERAHRLANGSRDEVERVVCRQEISMPSHSVSGKAKRKLEGDLDNIVLMAMRKDPGRRYSSAEQFAEDLRRHLEGLPVIARADTWSYRAGRTIKRHKIEATAVVLILASLCGGIAAARREANRAEEQRSFAEIQRARAEEALAATERQRREAEDQRSIAQQQRQVAETERGRAEEQSQATQEQRARAERRFAQVRQLAHWFLFDFDRSLQTLAGSTAPRQQLVKTALEYLASLSRDASSDASLLRELALSYEKVGDVQGNPYLPNVGDPAGALRSYDRAVEIRKKLANDSERSGELMLLLLKVGDVSSHLGDTKRAVDLTRQVLGVGEEALLRNASDNTVIEAMVQAHSRYGDLLDRSRNTEGALQQYRSGLHKLRQIEKARGPTSGTRQSTATTLRKMSMMAARTGDEEGALRYAVESLEIAEALAKSEVLNPVYARELMASLLAAGDTYNFSRARRPAAALPYYRRAVAIMEQAANSDRANVQAHGDLAIAKSRIGDVLLAMKEYREAVPLFAAAIQAHEKVVAIKPDAAQPRYALANYAIRMAPAQLGAGDRQGAILNLRRGLLLLEELTKTDPGSRLYRSGQYYSHRDLGKIHRDESNWSGAIASFESALRIAEEWRRMDTASEGARHSIAEASLYLARAYSSRAEGQKEAAAWMQTREQWTRTRNLWQEIAAAGRLSPDETSLVDEASDAIARCDLFLNSR